MTLRHKIYVQECSRTWYSFFYAKIGHNRNILNIFESDTFHSVSDIFFLSVVYRAVFKIWSLIKNNTIKKNITFPFFYLQNCNFRQIGNKKKSEKTEKGKNFSRGIMGNFKFQNHPGKTTKLRSQRILSFLRKFIILIVSKCGTKISIWKVVWNCFEKPPLDSSRGPS